MQNIQQTFARLNELMRPIRLLNEQELAEVNELLREINDKYSLGYNLETNKSDTPMTLDTLVERYNKSKETIEQAMKNHQEFIEEMNSMTKRLQELQINK